MKHYQISFASFLSHIPTNPERTAYRHSGHDVTIKEFSNRPAMLKCIELQENAGSKTRWWDWTKSKPAEKLASKGGQS